MVNMLAQMPGDVEFIAGEEGDAFQHGTALVRLDISALLEKRQQALTQLASAEAGHRNAVVQYNREVLNPNSQSNAMMGGLPSMFTMFSDPVRSMTGRGAPGYERHSNLVGQSTQVQTAANSVAQARAAIAELDDNIENATSRAPFNGVIVAKMVEKGDIVQPGMPLVSFADTSRMQIQVEVPARLVSQLTEGQTVMARLDRGGDVLPVTVDRIFPMAQQGGHTTTVKFGIPQGVQVQVGTYAEILLQDQSRVTTSQPVIPMSAIVWRGSLPAVFVVMDDGSLKMKTLRTGSQTGDGMISVITGVRAGDRILRNPTASTRSGPAG